MFSYPEIMNFRKSIYWFILGIIILFSLGVRLYFLDFNAEVSASDEAEYLIMAESFEKSEIIFQWPFYRPFLLPFLWGLLGKLGFELFTFRITLLLFSLTSVFLVYLISKDLFNEKVGLVAAFFMAFFPDEILHSVIVLLNTAALTMWLLSVYFFQRAYFKKSDKLLYFSAIVSGLSILLYTQNIVLIGFYFLFLLFAEGPRFIKNSKYIHFFLIQIGIYLLNFVYSWIWFGNPIKSFAYGLWLSYIDSNSRNYFAVVIDFIKYLPNYLSWVYMPVLFLVILILFKYIFLILKPAANARILKPFILGVLSLIIFIALKFFFLQNNYYDPRMKIIIYLSLTLLAVLFFLILIYIFKHAFVNISQNLNSSMKKHLFLILWFFVSFFVVANMVGNFQARYFLQAIVPLFIYFGFVIVLISIKLFRNRYIIVFLLLVLFSGGTYINLIYTDNLVDNYGTNLGSEYLGLWLKNNTEKNDVIFGPLNYALAYYSERYWYKYPVSQTFEGRTYEGFLDKVDELKPKYLVVYYSERYVSENDIYLEFLEKNKLTNVYRYFNPRGELIEIYKT